MERPLRIFEMTETADPIALARSRMLQSPLLREYAATRARSTVDSRSLRSDRSLWDLEMLPTGKLVSGVLGSVSILLIPRVVDAFLMLRLQLVQVSAARSDPPTPHSCAWSCGTAARAGAGGTQEGAREATSRASRTEEQGVPAARAAGALFSGDRGVLVLG
jgi:hypothetical protein